jgi:type IV pilus assembly protein PilY1
MNTLTKFSRRTLSALLATALVNSAYAAPLVLSQKLPATFTPPPPNILVTLDDSASMQGATGIVKYDPKILYKIPPGADGKPIREVPKLGLGYKFGLQSWPGYELFFENLDPAAPGGIGNAESGFQQEYLALNDNAQKNNYMIYYSFYRTRSLAMRSAVLSAFSGLDDDKFRIAWQSLQSECSNGFPAKESGNKRCDIKGSFLDNSMWTFSDKGSRKHKSNFIEFVRNHTVVTGQDTPLRDAVLRAGNYFSKEGIDSPWADQPGKSADAAQCRRSYHLLFTDGGNADTNSGIPESTYGNADNTGITLPDNTSYQQQAPYRGPGVDGVNTIADLAFKFWATDLQANLPNNLEPIIRFSGKEKYNGKDIDEYWNPKNNPATWQNVVLYAIAYGEGGKLDGNVKWVGPTTAGEDFAAIVSGDKPWPPVKYRASGGNAIEIEKDNVTDLWHAVVNSRGELYPAQNQKSMSLAFNNILSTISNQQMVIGGAVSSLAFVSDFKVVRTGYIGSPTPRADIRGYSVDEDHIVKIKSDWDAQIEVAKQDPVTERVILTASDHKTGVPFIWDNLSAFQQESLNSGGLGGERLRYLRGVTTNPAFRDRQGALIAPIANTEPRIVQAPRSGHLSESYRAFRDAKKSRTPIVYVGANDGMMHGIQTKDGKVALSYVPRGVYPNLPEYTDPSYTNKMFVDGPLISGDIQVGSTWKTVLVGGLGAGGLGLFVLDITDPSEFQQANAASLVMFDVTAPAVPPPSFTTEANNAGPNSLMAEVKTDMGLIYGDPSRDPALGRNLQISKLQNGKWALITGNGVNSVKERAVLYIIYLDGSGEFKKLLTDETENDGNGLSVPYTADMNGDGAVDVVYAGDLKGRLWKFDLRSDKPSDWTVVKENGVATPIITTANSRPITSAPAAVAHPKGGLMLTFGTGRQLIDNEPVKTESIYGIWDKPGGPHKVTDTDLDPRTLSASSVATADGGGMARVLDGAVTSVNYGAKRGWKMELALAKEKVVYNPMAQGSYAVFSTLEPGESGCSANQSGSVLAFDIFNGAEPSSMVIDVNGDGAFTSGDKAKGGENTVGRKTGVGKLSGIVGGVGGGVAGGTGSCIKQAIGAAGQVAINCQAGTGRVMWRDMRP